MAVANLTTAFGFGTWPVQRAGAACRRRYTVRAGRGTRLLLAAVFVGRRARAGVSRGTGA